MPPDFFLLYTKIIVGPVTKRKILTHLIEFFFIGLVMGVIEDILAIHFATDAQITPRTFLIAFIVAVPFAFISEIIVDLKFFRRFVFKKKN